MKILEVKNLHVSYGSIQAIKGISFHVNRGEIVSLIGANGAGKTTTMKALSGLLPCQQGQIELKGQDITQLEAHLRPAQGLAQSPEGRGIFAQMTVLENLEMGAYHRHDSGQIKKDLEHCMNLFPRVRERKNQIAGTLSGGEQQMVAICRSLMAKPQVLLLDEPSLGLAPLVVAQIFEIVKKVNQEGVTVLLVEQNARMALKISTRAYVLETGRITLEGPGSELLSNDEVRRSYLGI